MIFFKKPYSREEEKKILQAIRDVESSTTGEIKVLLMLKKKLKEDPVSYAQKKFYSLGMHQTVHRNAVLFVVFWKDRKVAVWGDEGIHSKVPPGFWNQLVADIVNSFRRQQGMDGLVEAIGRCGDFLKKYFPASSAPANPNEISDDIVLDHE